MSLTVHLLLQRGCSSGLIPEAFYASSLHQIGQNLYQKDHFTPSYMPVDPFWHIEAIVAMTSPQSDQPDQPFPATNLTAHDDYFEQTIEILPHRTKGQDLVQVETKCPSSTPINRCGFHRLREEKLEATFDKKSAPPVFSFSIIVSPPWLSATSTFTTNFTTTISTTIH